MNTATVVDYGLGNLFNLVTALRVLGAEVLVTDDPAKVTSADRLIIPGVGAFGRGVQLLREKKLDSAIVRFRESNKPLLGICLGMQFLMAESEEHGLHRGLGFIPGRVTRFKSPVNGARWTVPQISWNSLQPNDASRTDWSKSILRSLSSGTMMYFVHSYFVSTDDRSHTLAETTYAEQRYASIVNVDNVYGVQFHPERSARDGLTLLKNFLNIGEEVP